MAKVRVYELAKELGVTSKVVLTRLNDMGEFVRSASSTIEAPVVRRLAEEFEKNPPKKRAAKKAAASTSAAPQATAPVAPAEPAKKAAAAAPAERPAPAAEATPAPVAQPKPTVTEKVGRSGSGQVGADPGVKPGPRPGPKPGPRQEPAPARLRRPRPAAPAAAVVRGAGRQGRAEPRRHRQPGGRSAGRLRLQPRPAAEQSTRSGAASGWAGIRSASGCAAPACQGSAPRPGAPRPRCTASGWSGRWRPRPGAPRPGNNPFSSTQGMQRGGARPGPGGQGGVPVRVRARPGCRRVRRRPVVTTAVAQRPAASEWCARCAAPQPGDDAEVLGRYVHRSSVRSRRRRRWRRRGGRGRPGGGSGGPGAGRAAVAAVAAAVASVRRRRRPERPARWRRWPSGSGQPRSWRDAGCLRASGRSGPPWPQVEAGEAPGVRQHAGAGSRRRSRQAR